MTEDAKAENVPSNSSNSNGSAGPKPDKVPLWARICHWAGIAIVSLSLLLLVGRVLLGSLDLFPPKMELPLGRLDTIAVDKEGNIYCHSRLKMTYQLALDSHQDDQSDSVVLNDL